MVERIETIAVGASSTYGADAVAGVVNFIIKDDFEGHSKLTPTTATAMDNDGGPGRKQLLGRATTLHDRGGYRDEL